MALRRTLMTAMVLTAPCAQAFRPGFARGLSAMGGVASRRAVSGLSATAESMQNQISSEPVLMYSFTTCPFCMKAKGLLDKVGAKYTVVELDVVPEGMDMRSEMKKMIGRTSVPAVWIKGEFVGGCNDGPGLFPLHQAGKLVPMLEDAGAM
uniref:Glutaredoxin domain-containing protein n=1 Tax=Phaeomonas parva TaxID=124430 RepID=A0A7S1XNM2_9STRA|mmetsp:Transcript_25022/g.78406  ORF Transcript_25022/g.78406 Transcript_25022/m.78406 type:complete len:151 (+) Transcript_25022:46-498(+)